MKHISLLVFLKCVIMNLNKEESFVFIPLGKYSLFPNIGLQVYKALEGGIRELS